MAQELIIRSWCDNQAGEGTLLADGLAHPHGERVPAEERIVGVDYPVWRKLDLCDPCNEQIPRARLRELAAEFGRPLEQVQKGKPAAGALAAIERFQKSGQRNGRKPSGDRAIQCIWCPLPYAGTGFLKHVRDAHGFKDQTDAWGRTCPVCGKEGIDMLGTHAGRKHADIGTHTSDLFVWARDNGDPFGVYAERLKAGDNVVAA
jgi:hypothetical protein